MFLQISQLELDTATLEYGYCAAQVDSQRKIQQDATMYPNLLFHIYMKLNMFRKTHGQTSGA